MNHFFLPAAEMLASCSIEQRFCLLKELQSGLAKMPQVSALFWMVRPFFGFLLNGKDFRLDGKAAKVVDRFRNLLMMLHLNQKEGPDLLMMLHLNQKEGPDFRSKFLVRH